MRVGAAAMLHAILAVLSSALYLSCATYSVPSGQGQFGWYYGERLFVWER